MRVIPVLRLLVYERLVYAGDTSVECGEEDESLNSLETLAELRHRVRGDVLYKTYVTLGTRHSSA